MTATAAAAQAGVSLATVYRWLRAFDPARPIASVRPRKRGPQGPRWGDEEVEAVIEIIKHNPDLWSRRRVAAALADRSFDISERTVGDILAVARERLAREQEAQRRAAQARNSRRVAAMIRRDQRDAQRRDDVTRKLDEILVPGVTPESAIAQIAEALAAKGWKIEVKDLTPELRDLANAYLRWVYAHPEYLDATEGWLLETDRWKNRDHARVAALNHLVKRHRAGRPPRAKALIGFNGC